VAFSHSYAFCTWVVGVGWRLGLTIFLVAKSFRGRRNFFLASKTKAQITVAIFGVLLQQIQIYSRASTA